MKHTRLVARLVSVCMLMSLFASTFAVTGFAVDSDGTDLTITNTPADTGISITGKSFNVYEVFTATINDDNTVYEEDGEGGFTDVVVSYDDGLDYTVSPYFVDFFEAQLGDDFTYPDVDDYDGADDESYIAALTTATEAAKEFVSSYDNTLNNDGTTEDTAAAGSMQDLVALLRQYVLTNNITAVATTSVAHDPTSTGGSQSVSTTDAGLMGYYLVLDSADTLTAGSAAITGMLCNMPAISSDGRRTSDRTISLKASAPTIDKQIWHNELSAWEEVGDYQVGDTVKFLITADKPSNLVGYTDDTYTYIISDIMSNGLSFVPGSVTIYVDEGLTTEAQNEQHNNYFGEYSVEYDETTHSEVFSYKFNMVTIASLYPTLEKFYITYEAIVTADAVIAPNGYEENTVTLTYSTNPYDNTAVTSVEDTVYSYTFDLDVTKTAGDGTTPLADAYFSLYQINAGGEGKNTLVYFDLTIMPDGTNLYTVTSSPSATSSSVIVTDATGKFTIVGLDDAIAYRLVETNAPTGYNVADPIDFTITATYLEDSFGVVQLDTLTTSSGSISHTNNDLQTTIINTSSALLPSTGGMGTTLFTVGGIVLMVGAGIALLIKRKKS